jgi:PEP-CTERM motif
MIQRPIRLVFERVFALKRSGLAEVTNHRRRTLNGKTAWLALAAAMLWIGLGAGGRVEAGGIVLNTPAGLSPGDSFRFAFVTDGTTGATSTNIADYNNFVNAQAGGATYNGSVVTWDAIATTSSVNAIDNIGQSPISGVYLANGTLVTTSTTISGLWNPLLSPLINQDLSGVTFPSSGTIIVWTGTTPDGTTVNFWLGSNEVIYGVIGDTAGGAWVDANVSSAPATPFQMYGISQVLIVPNATVPEPSTLLIAGTAISAGFAFGWSRRRRGKRRHRPVGKPDSIW